MVWGSKVFRALWGICDNKCVGRTEVGDLWAMSRLAPSQYRTQAKVNSPNFVSKSTLKVHLTTKLPCPSSTMLVPSQLWGISQRSEVRARGNRSLAQVFSASLLPGYSYNAQPHAGVYAEDRENEDPGRWASHLSHPSNFTPLSGITGSSFSWSLKPEPC